MVERKSEDLTFKEALRKRFPPITLKQRAEAVKSTRKATRALLKVLEKLPETPPDEVPEMVDQTIQEEGIGENTKEKHDFSNST